MAKLAPKQRWPKHKDCYQSKKVDYLSAEEMPTLPAMFEARFKRSPEASAYSDYDADTGEWHHYSWGETWQRVEVLKRSLQQENLRQGDRIGICHSNCYMWVLTDLAALALGLVVVPLYVDDRAENIAYIINHAEIELLVLETRQQWEAISAFDDKLAQLVTIVIKEPAKNTDPRVVSMQSWLDSTDADFRHNTLINPHDLAMIVYTSGTTGKPKGVMLSHQNITSNVRTALKRIEVTPKDKFLSFLPLSHMLERTVGYYTPMMAGATVVFSRSVEHLGDDLKYHQPTILVSVPRIFERFHQAVEEKLEKSGKLKKWLFKQTLHVGSNYFEFTQKRGPLSPAVLSMPIVDELVAKPIRKQLGGRLRFAISGGAPLSPAIAEMFIAMGINVLQGYGLTETSPMVSGNTLEHNFPESIGIPFDGIETAIDSDTKELLIRGPNVMLGYLKDDQATAAAIDEDGWFHTGDQAKVEHGFLHLIGRIKEIIVLSNGEKVPPADIENAILRDPAFDQVLLVGEQRPWLSALVVLAEGKDLSEKDVLQKISTQMSGFPGYAELRKIHICSEQWSIDNGLMTPTLKMKRNNILDRYQNELNQLYA